MAEKNMALYTPGVQNAGTYQVSGVPFITGSVLGVSMEHRVKFPTVSKSITIINTDSTDNADIYVYFASTSSLDSEGAAHPGVHTNAKHYITLSEFNSSITMNVKAKEVYVQSTHANGAYQVFAELTNIPRDRMWKLSGSGINEYTRGLPGTQRGAGENRD